jgi:dipeptidyl aminopeptidase/acylaminoacyl peptidase/formylglycine-generating enzyme required for sulfatase activity
MIEMRCGMRFKTFIWLAVALVCFAAVGIIPVAGAQDTPKAGDSKTTPWTPDDILLAERSSQWEIAPDGKSAVWVMSQVDKEKNGSVSNLFLTNLETKAETQLTRGTESHSQPRWSPDGDWIAFISSRPLPKPKPELASSQLWIMSARGGEPYPVTELARGIRSYRWTGNDTIMFSAQEDPTLYEQELKKKKDATRVVDDVDHEPPVRLFRLAVKEKKITRLTENTDFIEGWAVSEDGGRALTVHQQYLSFAWDNKILPKIFLYDLSRGERKELFAGQRLVPRDIEWARDGSGVYFLAPYTTDPRFFEATITLVYYYDVASNSQVKVDLGWENGVGRGFAATPDGFIALLAAGARSRPVRYVKTGLTWKRQDLEGDQVANIFDFAVSRDGKSMVYEYSTASTPSQWHRADLEGQRLTRVTRLTDLNAAYKGKAPARTELVRWKGALGEEVEGLLYYPRNYEPGKKYPLLTAPHGGPAGADFDSWDESWAYAHQLLSQRGAFILKPNYHGSSDYGLKFVESICCGHYYDYPVEDIEKGVDSLIARGLVDPDRIGTLGWSNGSILSIAVSIANPGRYKVVSAGAGDVEFISDWGNVDFGEAFDTYYFGKSPLQDPQLYLRMAPFFKLDKVKAPTIIFFGTEDRNVPTSQGWSHYRALYYYGKVPVKFLLFPGEPHGPRQYVHQLRKVEEEMAWLDRYFFKTSKPENEAFKKDSPLGLALRRKDFARVGTKYGVAGKGDAVLIPEAVERGGLEIGRFEVTRAQFSAFDASSTYSAGTENYPANNVSFEKAKSYAEWLSKVTGQAWRLPNEDETAKLYEGLSGENTLDYWAGYALNPDDARRLEPKAAELGTAAPLLKEVGSFNSAGKDDEEPVYDLGGNVAEWAVAKDGTGKKMGGSADRPADPRARSGSAAMDYTGFRVVRGESKSKS